jgi:uncharacterized protein (DUF1501 family)
MSIGCNEFCRAHAGAGLPGIEPGMPMPAGTGLTRRSFLLRSAGVALAVYGGGSALRLAALEDGVASAAAARPGRVLVSVFLDGGADGLSMLFPAGDTRYTQLRPALALKPSTGLPFAEDNRLFWHPSLASLATLHGEGKVSAMPAIGYDHPDQSHFTSRHYWQVGATDAHLNSGWLGRFIDHVGTDANPLQGLSLGYQLAPQLATSSRPVATLDSAQSYDFRLNGVYGQPAERLRAAVGDLAHHDGSDAGIATAASTIVQSAELRFQLRAYATNRGGAPAGVAYPATRDSFPQHLQTLAGLLGAGFPIRAVAMRASGSYDTHSAEAQPLTQGLKTTADSLLAFQRDLEARGIADRVLVHVWTEFGRRGKENASGGTDHGAAGPGFLIGTRASGKMIGQFPGLADGSGLDRLGNLVPTADFRALYASLLEQWFQTDAAAVIPGAASFSRYSLLKA